MPAARRTTNWPPKADAASRRSTAQQSPAGNRPACGVVAGNSNPIVLRRYAVSGEPYSAVQESERIQTLADGTHIDQKGPTVRMFRDSQGRTRTETLQPANPATSMPESIAGIAINDPVAGVSYMLDPRTRIARRISSTFSPGYRVEGGSGAGPGLAQPNGIAETSAPNDGANARPAAPPRPSRPNSSYEDLGTREMEGLVAEGTRDLNTIPAGSQGNDRAITVVHETWCSTELWVNISTSVSDPRAGEFTTHLTNIERSEPDPALFQVPPDYTVTDLRPTTLRAVPPTNPSN